MRHYEELPAGPDDDLLGPGDWVEIPIVSEDGNFLAQVESKVFKPVDARKPHGLQWEGWLVRFPCDGADMIIWPGNTQFKIIDLDIPAPVPWEGQQVAVEMDTAE